MSRPRIAIVGGGFGGLAAARALRGCAADVVLIDRRNHHIFQPLLYQTATALLAPAEVAAPIRQVASGQANLSVMLGEVVGIDAQQRSVEVHTIRGDDEHIAFDYLVLAPGMQVSYFGHEEFALYAPSLKTMADAESICARILSAYEEAELCDDENERARLLTFVLVGAGPTGVELAASLAGLARSTLPSNFRRIDPATSRIVLIEAGPDSRSVCRSRRRLRRLAPYENLDPDAREPSRRLSRESFLEARKDAGSCCRGRKTANAGAQPTTQYHGLIAQMQAP
jgi:NADH:ubiquinone reductase (H+-translocating)